jgi:PHP family Zn ribbon phosphoesterase
VLTMFDALVSMFGSEHEILLRTSLESIRAQAGNEVASALEKVRLRDITIIPGFDGEYGKVSIEKTQNKEEGIRNLATFGLKDKEEEQMGLGI